MFVLLILVLFYCVFNLPIIVYGGGNIVQTNGINQGIDLRVGQEVPAVNMEALSPKLKRELNEIFEEYDIGDDFKRQLKEWAKFKGTWLKSIWDRLDEEGQLEWNNAVNVAKEGRFKKIIPSDNIRYPPRQLIPLPPRPPPPPPPIPPSQVPVIDMSNIDKEYKSTEHDTLAEIKRLRDKRFELGKERNEAKSSEVRLKLNREIETLKLEGDILKRKPFNIPLIHDILKIQRMQVDTLEQLKEDTRYNSQLSQYLNYNFNALNNRLNDISEVLQQLPAGVDQEAIKQAVMNAVKDAMPNIPPQPREGPPIDASVIERAIREAIGAMPRPEVNIPEGIIERIVNQIVERIPQPQPQPRGGPANINTEQIRDLLQEYANSGGNLQKLEEILRGVNEIKNGLGTVIR